MTTGTDDDVPVAPTECDCGGDGWTFQRNSAGRPLHRPLVHCLCWEAREGERKGKRLAQLCAQANLPGPLRRCILDNFDLTEPEVRPLFEKAKAYAEGKLTPWLAMFGTPGPGKTHLAVAVLQVRLRALVPGLFCYWPSMLDDLQEKQFKDDEYFGLLRQLKTVPFLVLDDIGPERQTPFRREQLDKVVNERYMNELPTVLTSNLKVAEFAAVYPRVYDRLSDKVVCTCVGTEAPSYRPKRQKD